MNFSCHIVAVCGIVENDKNQILMVKHNHYDWVFPDGQEAEEEDIITALKRDF